jgi:thiamine pyrophosphate-dependent acetolactate synthase large subunit-like protein
MSDTPIYEALAHAFKAEGVDTFFTLMGDGNMHWSTAMRNLAGVDMIHARHEHCACTMAMGYTSATGNVGVASVTCGPGFTQIMTALTTAARGRIPLVVFAGEVPMNAKWYVQTVDQAPIAAATGTHYIAAHAPRRMHQFVREAFYVARHERRPVVIGVPYDLQKQALPDLGPYEPSSAIVPSLAPLLPNPAEVDAFVEKLVAAECPVIVAGRGVLRSGARQAVEDLAERTGAVLMTTLMARGLYDHNPYCLGIAGGYARPIAREVGEAADLVVAIGASMTYYTVDGGGMFPRAEVVQVDAEPQGYRHGAKVADRYLRADAKLAVEAMLDRLGERPNTNAQVRTPELARRMREDPADLTVYEIPDGVLDPRAVIEELDRVLAKDYDTVCGSGHQSYFHSIMRGWDPEKYHQMRDFGAIGNSIGYAVGIAAARRNGKVILFEGDGSLIMHIQELETIRRHGLKLLICIMNDGAYGSEIHKFRQEGMDDSAAIFGRPDFAAIAKGFGLRGATVTDVGQFEELFRAYEAQDTAEVWDIHISDQVVTPRMRKQLRVGHGVI